MKTKIKISFFNEYFSFTKEFNSTMFIILGILHTYWNICEKSKYIY